jgi:hypothetical protein
MIVAFHTTQLIPHRFTAHLERYGREGWAIERAVVGDCAGSYFVEVGPQQRMIQSWRHADISEWSERRAKLAAHSGWKAFRAAQAESIGSEFERLFKPTISSRCAYIARTPASLIGSSRSMRRKGCRRSSPISATALAISAASMAGSTKSCISGATPTSTIGSGGAPLCSPTRRSRRFLRKACRIFRGRRTSSSVQTPSGALERSAAAPLVTRPRPAAPLRRGPRPGG